MFAGKRIAVVMPAFNAEKTLEKTLMDIEGKEFIDDIILVDDCSEDNTVDIAKNLGIRVVVHDKNKGYGGNQKTCYKEAIKQGADVIVMLHPDYQYSPKLVIAMAAMIASGEYDMVLASRITGKNNALTGGMPLYKYVANRFLTYIENFMMGLKMSEYHSGYRAFSKNVLTCLPLDKNSDGFIFDNQIISQAHFFGFKIGEISCPTRYENDSSSINIKRSILYGIGVLKTSLEYILRKYNIIFPEYLPKKLDSNKQEGIKKFHE